MAPAPAYAGSVNGQHMRVDIANTRCLYLSSSSTQQLQLSRPTWIQE